MAHPASQQIYSNTAIPLLYDDFPSPSPPTNPTYESITLTNTTNQIIFGTTKTTTLSAVAPGTSDTITIPDPGVATANVVLDQGTLSTAGIFSNGGAVVDVEYGGGASGPPTITIAYLQVGKAYTLSGTIHGMTFTIEDDNSATISLSISGPTLTPIANLWGTAVCAAGGLQAGIIYNSSTTQLYLDFSALTNTGTSDVYFTATGYHN